MKMTNGAKNALNKLAGNNPHKICKKCGFVLPKYPGRYPKVCPACGLAVPTSEKE